MLGVAPIALLPSTAHKRKGRKMTAATFNDHYELFQAVAEAFTCKHWTVAFGALVVSGVAPPAPDASEIPPSGFQLGSHSNPATPRELEIAQMVLDEWAEDFKEDLAAVGNPAPVGATQVDAIDFVEWCESAFQGIRQPRLLKYIYRHIFESSGLDPAGPIPQHLVTKGHELEQFSTAARQHGLASAAKDPSVIAPHESATAPKETVVPISPWSAAPALQGHAHRAQTAGDRIVFKHDLAPVLKTVVQALIDKRHDPRDVDLAFAELKELARQSKPLAPLTGLSDCERWVFWRKYRLIQEGERGEAGEMPGEMGLGHERFTRDNLRSLAWFRKKRPVDTSSDH